MQWMWIIGVAIVLLLSSLVWNRTGDSFGSHSVCDYSDILTCHPSNTNCKNASGKACSYDKGKKIGTCCDGCCKGISSQKSF